MRFAQEQYLRQCYREYTAALHRCQQCGGGAESERKRWDDALASVATYVDAIAIPKGFPPVRVSTNRMNGDVMMWGPTWEGGVFEGDNSDGGPRAWYWRVSKDTEDVVWATNPVDALIAWVTTLELHVGADPAARALQFIVRMPEASCRGDDHTWVFAREGRHGSEKGDLIYRCHICKMTKQVEGNF